MEQPQRPNYYDLLDLNPDAPWSAAAFQDQLTRKKAEWTRGRNHPIHALRFKSYLDMAADIEAVMGDPARREAERDAARLLRSRKMQEAQTRFDQELPLRVAKGYLTDREVLSLIREYAPLLTEAAVRAAVERAAVPVRHEAAPPADREQVPLDPSLTRAIQSNLAIVGSADLYAFLGMARTSRTADLLERATAVYAENQKQANKTAQVTARSDLAGQGMTVFGDDDTRAQYDSALADQAFAGIGEAIQRITQESRTLHAAQFEMLLEGARTQGLDIDRAEGYIRRRVQELGAALYVSDTGRLRQMRRCPACGTLADPEAANCARCATPLVIACPACGDTMPTEYRACSRCGFPIGNLANVDSLVREVESCLQRGDQEAAAEYLAEARRQWSPGPGAPPRRLEDSLSQAIDRLDRALRAGQQAQAGALRELQICLDERRYYAARRRLRDIDRSWPGLDLDAARRQIAEAIRRAEADLGRARDAEARGEDAAALYQHILQACRDCRPARDALSRTPPPPPGPLTVQIDGQTARLRWEPVPAQGVAYAVFRRYGSRPSAPAEAEALDTIPGTVYDDDQVAAGLPVFYAVYTSREGVLSVDAALSPEPILFTAPVTLLAAQVDDGLVRLRWQAPPNTARVEVRRGEGHAPRNLEEGRPIRVFGLNDAVDAAVQNGRTYSYSVFPIFYTHRGEPISGPPASVQATPQQPPAPIADMAVESTRRGDEHDLRITWPPPNKGEAALLQSDRPPDLRPGYAVAPQTLDSLGRIIAAPRHEVTLHLQGAGVTYLTPIVLFQDMAYPGITQTYTALDDVRDLQAYRAGDAIHLTWQWPRNCQYALIVWRHDRFARADDPDAAQVWLTRAEYDLHRGYWIEPVQPRDYYITVFAALLQGEQRLIAPGQEPTCRQRLSLASRMDVRYSVDQPRRLRGGGLRLTVTVSGAGDLPDLVLVGHGASPPPRKVDGQPVLHLPVRYLDRPRTSFTADIEASAFPPDHLRLFLADDSLYTAQGGYVRLHHPEPDAHTPTAAKKESASVATCPFCFTRFPLAEAPFRCGNPRCEGRVEDPVYAEYQGLLAPEKMGPIFSVGAEPGRSRRAAAAGTCPSCGHETHRRVCPTCHYELLHDAGRAAERLIAVIGGRGTGKSNYIAMLINQLENIAGVALGVAIRAVGDRTRERYERDFYAPLFRQNRVIPPTQTAAVDPATRTPMVFRLTTNEGGVANLVLFDTAGEDMQALSTMSSEARYILHADALLFLLDPLQIPAVRQMLPAEHLPPPDPGAEPEYIVERLRELYEQYYGLKSAERITRPVAFTLSKIDMLLPLLDPGSGLRHNAEDDQDSVHAEIAACLEMWMGPRLTTLIRADFARYRYFGVSSFGRPPEGAASGAQTVTGLAPIRVEDPIRWILSEFGLLRR